MLLATPTKVDGHTSFALSFPHLNALAVLSCGITLSTPNPGLVIRLRKGNIFVDAPIYRPDKVTVQYLDKEGSDTVVKQEVKTFVNGGDVPGGGWHWQADEVARCVRDGKVESRVWGWDKTLLEMEVFDKVSTPIF